MLVGGVDEAGRGPVIGPMVIAIAAIQERDMFQLHALGIKDSKLLSPKKRLELFRIIKKLTKYKIIKITNKQVDSALNSLDTNLNWLEADYSALLVNSIKPKKVILDCPSNNLQDYKNYIQKKLKIETDIVVEHKADVNNVIVGAASILAKVTRDKEIQKLKDKYNVEFGSGYPSDPLTQMFLKHNYNKYDFFRKTWESYRKVLREKSQKRLGEF